jgi:predicted permease
MVQMNPPPTSYTPERLNALYAEMEQRLKRLPGVEQVGLALYNPLTNNWGESIEVAGRPPLTGEDTGSSWDRVSAGYMQTLGQQIVRGRGFTQADNASTAPVAIVNEAFVKRFFPKEDPLDKHFGMDEMAYAGTFRIIGVLRNAKYAFPRESARPMFFVPLAQWVQYGHTPAGKLPMQRLELMSHFISGIALLTHTSAGALEPLVARTLADLDPNLTIIRMQTLDDQVAMEFDAERAVASLAELFGLVALLLAAVGLYGVTAYVVAQRTGEIGVRMALGADRQKVIQLVLQGAFRRVGLGLLIGIPLAIGAGRLLASQLWGVKAWDPLALTMATASLAACAFLAAIIPALRAAAIHPMEALRAE